MGQTNCCLQCWPQPTWVSAQRRAAARCDAGLNRSSTYPSTEQTLSALSVVVNGGGLGQIGDIVRSSNAALGGREDKVRDLLTWPTTSSACSAQQRDSINAAVTSLNNLAGTFAGQREVLTNALNRIPPALDVLINERPRIVTALTKFRDFPTWPPGWSTTPRRTWFRNRTLEPTLKSLADVGPKLTPRWRTTFPHTQGFVDRAIGATTRTSSSSSTSPSRGSSTRCPRCPPGATRTPNWFRHRVIRSGQRTPTIHCTRRSSSVPARRWPTYRRCCPQAPALRPPTRRGADRQPPARHGIGPGLLPAHRPRTLAGPPLPGPDPASLPQDGGN